MKTKMKMLLAVLSVALLMVFSFNVFSQGNKPVQDDKSKKPGCMAMMQDDAQMKDCMAMMEGKEMKEMCANMMVSMKKGSSMCNMSGMKSEDHKKATEQESQKL